MTLQEREAQAQQKSVALYLRRQTVQEQLQGLQLQGQQIDRELIALDGEIRVLQRLQAEPKEGS